MRKYRTFLLRLLVVLVVAGLHVASLATLFLRSNDQVLSVNMGASVPLQVHHFNILGDSTVNSIEEAPVIDEPIEVPIKEEIVENKEELIATTVENQDHQIIKPMIDLPIKTEPVKKTIVKNKPKPIIRTQPVKRVNKEIAEGKKPSKAHSISMQKPMVTDVSILKNPTPHYPRSSRLRKETGKVIVLMEFNERGVPIHVHVERSSGYAVLDDSALKAARGVRSRPYFIEGQAISFRHRMIYEFNLT